MGWPLQSWWQEYFPSILYASLRTCTAFNGTRTFTTACTSALHFFLSWDSSNQSYTHNPLPKGHLNIILPSTPGSPKCPRFLSLTFIHRKPVYALLLPHTCYIPHLSDSSRFYKPNCIWWRAQTIKFHIIKFCPLPCYLFPVRPKYSPQNLILK